MASQQQNQFKYLGLITALYVTFQLVSDVTAGKLISFFGFPVSVTVIYFPLTYIFADVLTEVYGYARARRTLWIVLMASVTAGLLYIPVAHLPPATGFDATNEAYRRVFGVVPRILVGGWLAVFAGEISNDYVMAKLKVWCEGRFLWVRFITSTIVGQFINTAIFYFIGLFGILPSDILIQAIITGWILKVIVEAVFTPVTYAVTGFLKRSEGVDYYDRDTNFNPFRLHVD